MARKYDISKASDMRRFERDLKEAALQEAKKQLEKHGVAFVCPKCGNTIQVHTGQNTCPFCKSELNVHPEG